MLGCQYSGQTLIGVQTYTRQNAKFNFLAALPLLIKSSQLN